MRSRAPLLLALLVTLGCGEGERRFTEPMVLGGQTIQPEVLNRGEFVYMRYCRACHGQIGDGRGPHASRYDPRPANFTTGRFRHAAPDGSLPTDAALRRVITEGIEGTGMVGIPLSETERTAVIAYLKTLSPRWREGASGDGQSSVRPN